jgi:DNA-3-methyladenine glycosylase II
MRFSLKPVSPFNFDVSAQIFGDGDEQIRKYHDGKFWQVLRSNCKLLFALIQGRGSIDQPGLTVNLSSDEPLFETDCQSLRYKVSLVFNLDFDLKPFYTDIENDVTMNRIARRLYGLKSPTTPTVFESLVDSLVEQQISLRVANTIEKRITKKFGDKLKIEDILYYAYPTPEQLAAADVGQLRECGLSARKSEYIKNASKLIVDGKLALEELRNQTTDKIIEELDSVRGIGTWTAEMTCVRGMGKLDAIPADDLGLRRTISHYYCNDRKITSQEARRISNNWGKWKGLASYYLIVAERLGIE